MLTFGERLKNLRMLKKVTQEQLAADLGFSTRGIQNYEGGFRKPTYDALAAIASYFDVPADYLLGIGFFKNWEDIISQKETIILTLEGINPAFKELRMNQWDELHLMKMLSAICEQIDVRGRTVVLHPKLPIDDLRTITFHRPEPDA